MKKILFASLCIALLSTGPVLAANESEQSLIEFLDVKSTNTVNGSVTVDDGSQVNVGGVEIGGADVKGTLKIDTTNEVGEIEARDDSVVSVGGFSGRGMTSEGDVTFTALNKVDGKITATDGGEVYVGAAQLDGMHFGSGAKITTENNVHGDIKATGGRVNIGSVTN